MNDSTRWIGTREAAALLGVNPRAVQKRAARGSIAARQRAGKWEIDADALDASIGRQRDAGDAATDAPHVQSGRDLDASTGDNGRVHMDAMGAVAASERLAEARAEIAFLRGVIEQLQRDGAETRAALREALKSRPRELAAGDAATAPIEPRDGPQSAEMGNHSPKRAKGRERPPDRRESALTYGDIADELERAMLERRGS